MNLHGLGPGATLVLVDGHRLAPAGNGGDFADVGLIPLSAVERVEILTDGASAVYGADAVAGVVNFVLRKDYEGAETTLRGGTTTDGGGTQRIASQLFGHTWSSGSAVLNYEFQDQHPVEASSRDFIPDQGGTFYLSPQQRRNSLFATARENMTQDMTLYSEGFYSDRTSVADAVIVAAADRTFSEAKQYGGTAGMNYGLGYDWSLDLSGSMSRIGQHATVVVTTGSSTEADTSAVYSADLHVDGSVGRISSGDVRVAMGAEFRRETFQPNSTAAAPAGSIERNVESAYAEALVPLVGGKDAPLFARRLELTVAGRFDDYQGTGSSTNPKVGLLWSPLLGLNIRASYATSFRAPTLQETTSADQQYLLLPFPNPASPTGLTNTLLNESVGNPSLGPEKSRSWTAGFDIKPEAIPSLTLSATYYHISYTDRIGNPVINGGLFNLYQVTSALAPFLNLSPNLAELQKIFATQPVLTIPPGQGPGDVQAIFDYRPTNLASSTASGAEISGSYRKQTSVGDFGLSIAADYLDALRYQAQLSMPVSIW